MKNFNFLLAVLVFTTSTAHAVSDSKTLVLGASISAAVSIVVTPAAVASALDLTTTQADLQVAVVAETSNSASGYVIKAKSANASKILHSDGAGAGQEVPYTIKYGAGSAVTLTTTDQTVKTQSTGGNYAGVNSNVKLSYTGNSGLKSGAYADTITFTIESI